MKRSLLVLGVLLAVAGVAVIGAGCEASGPNYARNLECGPQGCPISGAPADMLDPAAYAQSPNPFSSPVEEAP